MSSESEDTFRFLGKQYEYFSHPYNRARDNMRTLEVPIIRRILYQQPVAARILEIGNVLSHYLPLGSVPTWDVLDLQEGPIHKDLRTWEAKQRYDLIVSISTLEHIGFGKFDDTLGATDYSAIILKIRSLLAKGGKAYITIPTGYNPILDKHLFYEALDVEVYGCMERVDDKGTWEECSLWDALKKPYRKDSSPWSKAMVVLLCD